MNLDPRIFIVIGIVSFAFCITSYYHMAIQRGWSVGNFFTPDRFSGFKLFAIITIIYFSFASAIDFGWYFILVTPISGFAIAFVITQIFKSWIQMISLIGFILLILTNIIIQIEVISP